MPKTWHTLLLVALLFLSCCSALHESDVGVVDWHKSLIGAPSVGSSTTAPKFHRIGGGGKNTQSVIVTATESNALAGLSAVNGSVEWRYVFEPEDRIISFYKQAWVVASLSGPGGANLRLFNALSGDMLLEKQLHSPTSGLLSEPAHLGSFVSFGNDTMGVGTPDLFVLSNGHTVSHFIGRDKQWTWTSEDQTSLVIYSQLLVTSHSIYVVGLAKSLASYTLYITSLSPANGQVIASAHVPSSLDAGLEGLLSLKSTSSEPHLVWLEQNTLKYLSLSPNLKGKPNTYRGSSYYKITDIGLTENGFFMATKTSDQSDHALKLVDTTLQLAWDFEGSGPSQHHSASNYAGGFDKEGRPYIGRLYWSYSLQGASAELFAPHLSDGRGLISGYSFRFDTNLHGTITHITMDAANPNPYHVLGRLVITTSAGTVQLWQQDQLQWSRDESLAEITSSDFVELPENVLEAAEEHEGFVGRLERQIKQARNFPSYLIHFAKRFATGSYDSVSSPVTPSSHTKSSLHRDTFGFRQVIVLTTSRGKVFGIDSSNGEVLWSKLLGLGPRQGEEGARVKPFKTFVVKAVGDASADIEESATANIEGPEVVIVAQRKSVLSVEEVVLYHVNALTGEHATKSLRRPGPLTGEKLVAGSVTDVYLLKSPHGKVVVVVDDKLKVHLHPNTPASQSLFASSAKSLSVSLRLTADSIGQHRIVGHQFVQSPDTTTAVPVWTFSLPEGEDIQSVIPPTRGPVASIGKVLGNRTTLYKYLNEHLFVVLTAPHSSALTHSVCGIYLVDGVKGSTVYHASLPSVGGTCDVKSVLTENWLVYHYFDEDSKTYHMVSVELYEGKQADDKTRSSDITSYSAKSLDLTAIEQSYVYLHGITAIAATSTKYGITTKDIIVASNGKIQTISHRLLDPRRPNRKLTTQEAEEFLVQYDPVIPDDPRQVISHNYRIYKVEKLVTAPSLLESTSLVFAYGLDLFLSRVSPSRTFDVLSENFNKTQLVATVLALGVAILFAKPAVNRKKLKEKWYS